MSTLCLKEKLSTFRDGTVSNAVHDRHLAIEEGWRAQAEAERDQLKATTRRLAQERDQLQAFNDHNLSAFGLHIDRAGAENRRLREALEWTRTVLLERPMMTSEAKRFRTAIIEYLDAALAAPPTPEPTP